VSSNLEQITRIPGNRKNRNKRGVVMKEGDCLTSFAMTRGDLSPVKHPGKSAIFSGNAL